MPKKTNIAINGSTYYRVTATVGKNANGTSIRKQFYGSSKKDAESKRDEYLAGLRQGLSVGYDKTTFGNAFKHWFEHVHRHSIGLSTYKKYSSYHRLYISDCGFVGMRLIDVKSANIQGYYNDLLAITSAKNIRQIHKILNIFFTYCLKADILVKNPLLAVELPKIPLQSDSPNVALKDNDIEMLLAACKEDIRYFPFVFACFTGLRAGELLALTFKDVDFKSSMISVNKSVTHLSINGEYSTILSETKTVASIRQVPILDEIQELLLVHINEIRQHSNILPFSGDFLLFPSSTGTYQKQCNFLGSYKRLCDKLGIIKGRTIHSLRHTFCTILARQGVSLLDASRLMGHSNINITARIYSHVSHDDKKIAVQKLSSYFH